MKILVVNGPNLNMLGKRDPAVYSSRTYEDLLDMIGEKAGKLNMTVEVFQSNHEGAIIDRLQDALSDGTEGLVINPGAFTHYSYAIHDALEILSFPKIEVHISDINTREEFRRVSVTRPACDGQIVGEGFEGYLHAMEEVLKLIKER
ncbi:MAG: type II 3-dehydroquinate dehydratase [Lachnospiraceae bacterium]|nr:type II 3-dehydroquinate dehydratase [Lachnospiraceae bacterium]